MKKVKFNIIQSPDKDSILTKDKQYSVWLRSGLTVYFPSYKAAVSFLVKTNDFFNQKLADYNLVFLELFLLYRQLWFVIDIKQSHKLKNDFCQLLDYFDKLPEYKSVNAHYYIYRDFEHIHLYLLGICTIMTDQAMDKKRYDTALLIKTILQRINQLQQEINNYGKGL